MVPNTENSRGEDRKSTPPPSTARSADVSFLRELDTLSRAAAAAEEEAAAAAAAAAEALSQLYFFHALGWDV
ncbi:hypothetical protein GUJ93_ZPchr0006g45631 [Zizania palustris]|uniref:Uncharacterized protein n=1 Tax=Zizania palustris TaxID=103762 RepID=A0A8J5W446_ZIZPA|nr:hypothetical protein GUJ93_ZPchr0006g45631 [Zizania palustris]